jgi:hypothetical protein
MILSPVSRRMALVACVSCLAGMRAFAQLTVAVQMDPNPSPYISDWRSNPNTIRLIVTNATQATQNVRLDAYIEGARRGRVAETKLDAAIPPVAVSPGTVMLSAVDAHVLEEGAVRYIGQTQNETMMSGRLPDDQFKLCVKLVAYDAPHAALSPQMCASFQISLLQPADLILPANGSSQHTPPSFQWSVVPIGTGQFARYELTVKELDPGQSNAPAAFQTNPPLAARETNLPVYQYLPSDPPLQPGHRYAWCVRSFDPDNRHVFVNNGVSQIWTFTYGAETVMSDVVALAPHFPDKLARGQRSERPQFAVKLNTRINLSSVTGGKLTIWRLPGANAAPEAAIGRDELVVFSQTFTGNQSLRFLDENGPSELLEFGIVNRTGSQHVFTAAKGEAYAWQATLYFQGDKIRNDKKFVNAKEAASSIGKYVIDIPDVFFPDTLVAGTFRIVVESWDSPTKSVSKTMPSGIGYVKFSCGSGLYRRMKNPLFNTKEYNLIEVPAATKNLSTGVKAYDSAKVKMEAKTPVATHIGDLGSLLPVASGGDGIRVAFHDVHWKGEVQSTVILDEGIATYPTVPAIPPVPAMIDIDSGFTLAIDTLTITPSDAIVSGSILLPPTIIAAEQCTPARIGLPPTSITSHCEFYRMVPDSSFGPFYVGETDIIIQGKGYIVDFSSTMSPSGPPPLANSWKGIDLLKGVTPYTVGAVISNRGYTKAQYTFADALITAGGLTATLRIKDPFKFKTVDPFGYDISLAGNPSTDNLRVRNSAITGGNFLKTHVGLPIRAVRDVVGKAISVECDSLLVQSDMDMFARVTLPAGANLTWGEFVRTPGEPRFYQLAAKKDVQGQLYFAARSMKPYYPLKDTVYKAPVVNLTDDGAQVEAEGRQGVTLKGESDMTYIIWSKDIPDSTKPLRFQENIAKSIWMNVVGDGVHAEIRLLRETAFSADVGPTWKTDLSYVGGTPFKLLFLGTQKEKGVPMMTRFVSSAVWDSDWKGTIPFAFPIQDTIPFARLMFTSTANCAGGQLDLAAPAKLDYWGLKLVAKDPKKSAGIVCVKKGVVYLTAAGFHEPVHFDVPFNLIWGELKANGNLGRLYFDYNNAGQKFDHFPYTQSFVALSEYAVGTDTGYVQTCGTVSVSFFGAKRMSIADYKCKNDSLPYRGRTVRLADSLKIGCAPSDLHWERDWAGPLGAFAFDIDYDAKAQEGFVGTGTTKLKLIGGSMASTIVVRADRSCICIADEEKISHSITLGWDLSFAGMAKVWGCGCIVGEKLESFVVGGELEMSSTVESGLVARGGAIIAVKLAIRPAWYRFEASGDFFLSLGPGIGDAELSGSVDILQDNTKGVCAGTLKGSVSFSSLISGITGDGEFEWVFGETSKSLQGRVAVNIFGSASAGVECGLFIGIRAPKDHAWVLDDMDGHFGVQKGGLPSLLTGFYAYLSTSASLNLAVISGGYKAYAGVGAFADFTGTSIVNGLGVLGNVGIHVWGEMLAGFASVEAWGNLQILAGVPPAFHGSLGMEACVLWSICASIEVGCGYNIIDGLYFD